MKQDSRACLIEWRGRPKQNSNRRTGLAKVRLFDDLARMQIYERATDLLEAEVGDELVALNPDAGLCFGFNSVATTVWLQLKTAKTFDQLKSHLLEEYDIDEERCGKELQALLTQMSEKRLISCRGE